MNREVLELLNSVIKVNVDSLSSGRYFDKDNNFYDNIEFIIDMFDKYVELLDKINVNNYLCYRYRSINLTSKEIKLLCYEVFKYIDNITDNNYNFYDKFVMVIKCGMFNLSSDNDDWNTVSDNCSVKVNGKLSYTIHDVISIIHEFFHLDYVNLIGLDNVKSMSENISIYFETLAIKFLSDKGMFYDGVISSYLKRLIGNFGDVEKNYIELNIMYLYKKYGYIDNEIVNKLGINELVVGFINSHVDKPKIDVFDSYPYILGILVSNNLLFSNYDEMDVTCRLLTIYDNISSYKFNDILDMLYYDEIDTDVIANNSREFLNQSIYKKLKRSISCK